MHVRTLFLALLAAAIYGCDDGAQHGRFAVNGTSSRSVANVPGALTIVQGDPQPLTAQSTGQQPLLYVLFLAPSITATGSGLRHEDGKLVSTLEQTWDTAGGKVAVALSWNRQTDQVTAGGATFDRGQGNVFVLVRDPSGVVTATQSGPVDAGLDELTALPKIQAALPADSPAKGVTLVR
jgi:hypothetical protein